VIRGYRSSFGAALAAGSWRFQIYTRESDLGRDTRATERPYVPRYRRIRRFDHPPRPLRTPFAVRILSRIPAADLTRACTYTLYPYTRFLGLTDPPSSLGGSAENRLSTSRPSPHITIIEEVDAIYSRTSTRRSPFQRNLPRLLSALHPLLIRALRLSLPRLGCFEFISALWNASGHRSDYTLRSTCLHATCCTR